MLRLLFWGECLRYSRAMCCGRRKKHADAEKRPHVFCEREEIW